MQGSRPPATAAAGVAVEEGGERVDGQGVAADVGQPDEGPEPARDGVLAHRGGEEEEPLHAEAAEDKDAQLPLVPPMQSAQDAGQGRCSSTCAVSCLDLKLHYAVCSRHNVSLSGDSHRMSRSFD